MKTRKASCHHWSIKPATPVEASSSNFACGSRSVFVFVMVLLAPSWLLLAQVWWLHIGWMVMVSSKKGWSTRKNNWKLEEQKVTLYTQTRKNILQGGRPNKVFGICLILGTKFDPNGLLLGSIKMLAFRNSTTQKAKNEWKLPQGKTLNNYPSVFCFSFGTMKQIVVKLPKLSAFCSHLITKFSQRKGIFKGRVVAGSKNP